MVTEQQSQLPVMSLEDFIRHFLESLTLGIDIAVGFIIAISIIRGFIMYIKLIRNLRSSKQKKRKA